MANLPSGLPDLIGNDEDIARFLVQSSQYNALMVKPAAFLPNPKDRETSVSRHGRDPLNRLWAIGDVAANGRNLHGVAILKAQSIKEVKLELIADEPPPRHAAIRGWPWLPDDPMEQKAQQKEKAAILASKSDLIIYPT